MKQLQLGEHRLLGVEMPKGAPIGEWYLKTMPDNSQAIAMSISDEVGNKGTGYLNCDLPPGNWVKVGFAGQLTEEQAKGLVETSTLHSSEGMKSQYRNYTFTADVKQFDTALESWNSFMRANNINPDTLILKEI